MDNKNEQTTIGGEMNSVESHIAVVTHKIETLSHDVDEVKKALVALTQVLSKLALVEERQSNFSEIIEKNSYTINSLESRIDTLEKHDNTYALITKVVFGSIGSIAGAIGAYFLTKL